MDGILILRMVVVQLKITMMYVIWKAMRLVNQGWQTMTDPYSGKQLVYKDYHGAMDDEIFNSPALMQDHYISINGGMIKELLLPV